jgi:hypothetical protein
LLYHYNTLYKKKKPTAAQPPTLAVYFNPGGVQQELVVGSAKVQKNEYLSNFLGTFLQITPQNEIQDFRV